MADISQIEVGNTTYDVKAKSFSGTLPIANGGTGANNAAAALSNLGGVSMKLIWTNSRPTSTFAAQTISIDLSGYAFVIIKVKYNYHDEYFVSSLCRVGEQDNLSIHNDSGSPYLFTRVATTSLSGIAISSGYLWYGANSSIVDNNMCIPVEIYGIKGVN